MSEPISPSHSIASGPPHEDAPASVQSVDGLATPQDVANEALPDAHGQVTAPRDGLSYNDERTSGETANETMVPETAEHGAPEEHSALAEDDGPAAPSADRATLESNAIEPVTPDPPPPEPMPSRVMAAATPADFGSNPKADEVLPAAADPAPTLLAPVSPFVEAAHAIDGRPRPILLRASGIIGVSACLVGLLILMAGCAGVKNAGYLASVPIVLGAIGFALSILSAVIESDRIQAEETHVLASFFVNLLGVIGGVVEFAVQHGWTLLHQ